MIGRSLNKCNDLFLENGSIATIDAGDQVVQHVRTRLLTYLEEWFLDTTAGLPYFQQIFIKPANLTLTEAVIRNEILETSDVEKLISFEFTFNKTKRTLEVKFEAQTTFGVVSSTLRMNQTTIEIQNG